MTNAPKKRRRRTCALTQGIENTQKHDEPPPATSLKNASDARAGICIASSPVTNSHGGARNHRERVSYSLSEKQVRNLLAAADFAWKTGKPLNRHCTAHFGIIGLEDREGMDALTAFLKLAREWCWRRGEDLAYIWTRETAQLGTHAHVFYHIPDRINSAFARHQWRLIRQACNKAYAPHACKSRLVTGWSRYVDGEPATFIANYNEVLGYLLKGADRTVIESLNLPKQQYGGRVTGKRCGTSQNIGKAARLAMMGNPRV